MRYNKHQINHIRKRRYESLKPGKVSGSDVKLTKNWRNLHYEKGILESVQSVSQ